MGLALLVLAAADLVEDGEEEDDFVALVEEEEGVVLDVLELAVVVAEALLDGVVVLELAALDVL